MWEHFWMIPKENDVVPIVQEFYASLQDHDSRNTEGRIWDMVLVRGKEVQVGVNGNIAQVLVCRNIDSGTEIKHEVGAFWSAQSNLKLGNIS
ncbi:hypothetical protein J1N35_005067 [Gossypium stocksii]|uniref:Uncharacterized protein n=1 Tax=Gossypium stocksii TaxID=47602 RepID=A0A9D4AGP4_9ROSI|nr:hypothetical protein J1N35_005067 [Gossypium stocksii]